MKPYAVTFYKSKAWKTTREAYASSVGYICERCEAGGRYGVPGEIVHHKIHLTPANISDPRISLDWNNLELLCRDCHAKEHGARKKRYTVHPDGSVEIL